MTILQGQLRGAAGGALLWMGFATCAVLTWDATDITSAAPAPDSQNSFQSRVRELYDAAGLDEILDQKVFTLAMIGYVNLLGRDALPLDTPLTIIDYTRPSTEERLVVVDPLEQRILTKTLVAHGRNSGDNYAVRFSDKPGSLMSSLGFFVTGDTYQGKHGYSLKLHGLEKPFNGNAEKRSVIIHGADYVSPEFIRKYGRLGRSWGCPALPPQVSAEVIDTIKGGTCLFVYYNDPAYLENSELLDKERAATWYVNTQKHSGGRGP